MITRRDRLDAGGQQQYVTLHHRMLLLVRQIRAPAAALNPSSRRQAHSSARQPRNSAPTAG